jgi:tRNA dimethylallyltransferase
MMNKKLIVIAGPTAVGKTDVAISVAKFYGTEIISADSRQLFKELNIGTAKPSDLQLSIVPHHFISSHSIHETYDAAQFGRDVLILLQKLFEKHDAVVLCGGSGLYIKAVCEGFDDIPEIPESVRAGLVRDYELYGIGRLQEQLKEHDPLHYAAIDIQNPHRLIRALEVVLSTGKSLGSFQKKKKLEHTFSIAKVGLELPREELYRRIDERVDKMIAHGLFTEAEALYPNKKNQSLQTVGYLEIFDFMDGKFDRAEAIRLIKRNSRRYAKRQLTWFKRDAEIFWMNPANIEEIIAQVSTASAKH